MKKTNVYLFLCDLWLFLGDGSTRLDAFVFFVVVGCLYGLLDLLALSSSTTSIAGEALDGTASFCPGGAELSGSLSLVSDSVCDADEDEDEGGGLF